MTDLQFYSTKVISEPEDSNTSLITVQGVDLSEIVAQVSIGDLLENLEYEDVIAYYKAQKDDE